jgi:glycosyltransferase involved in cell wall biosynthesis
MNIDVLCNDGSPLGITTKDLWGKGRRGVGVGGSEYALLTMCEQWHRAGHRVRLYNDPLDPEGSEFEQLPIGAFQPKDKRRDVVVIFRSPNDRGVVADGLKVWWSCDQYTIGSFKDFAPFVDKIVCISDFHADYFRRTYQITDAEVIDLPVRLHDLENKSVERVPNKLIFTSVPDRGLNFMRDAWHRIKMSNEKASISITADYRLWGLIEPRNEKFRMQWLGMQDVHFLGAVPRARLIEEQLSADIFAYPNIYDELFCVSCAEAQVCGAYPVTSGIGALSTTNMGTIIGGDPRDGRSTFLRKFTERILEYLDNRDVLEERREEIRKKAIERFSPDTILKQWDEKIFS